MIVIILWDNEIEKLEKTLESLPKEGGTAIRVSVWNPAGTSMPETLLKKYPDIFQNVSTTIAFGAVTVLRQGEYYSDPGDARKADKTPGRGERLQRSHSGSMRSGKPASK